MEMGGGKKAFSKEGKTLKDSFIINKVRANMCPLITKDFMF